jgi:hypothetical protein
MARRPALPGAAHSASCGRHRVRDGSRGSSHQRFPLLLCLALALVTVPARGVAAFVTPTLGNSYLLEQLTFKANTAASTGGSFANATFRANNPLWQTSQVQRTVVWDSRNNGLAYMNDYTVIRVLDFANPTSATAVSTLVVPGYATIPYLASICGDSKTPQTLYVTTNRYGGQGKVYAILLDFVNGARGGARQAARQAARLLTRAAAAQASPSRFSALTEAPPLARSTPPAATCTSPATTTTLAITTPPCACWTRRAPLQRRARLRLPAASPAGLLMAISTGPR